jgi:acetyltransferase-like isoleucine patch superfamily enzyme
VKIHNLASVLKRYYGQLSIKVNPFSAKRKRPLSTRYLRYTRDVLKGPGFDIGEYTFGKPSIGFMRPTQKLKIGKFCQISGGVIILFINHTMELISTYPFHGFVDTWSRASSLRIPEPVSITDDLVIGNDVWIGQDVMILPSVGRIGDGAVIGARAVVTKDVEPYSIVAGNPARLIRKRFDEETIKKLLETEWWNWPIEKINENLDIIFGNDSTKLFQI